MKMLMRKFVLLILISISLATCDTDKHRKTHDHKVTSPIQNQSSGINDEVQFLFNKLLELLFKGLKGVNDIAENTTHYVEDGELEDKISSILESAITYVKSFDKGVNKKGKRATSRYNKENSKEETSGEIGEKVEILLRNVIVRVPDIFNGIFLTAEHLSEPLINFLHNSPYTNKIEGYLKDEVNSLASQFAERAEKKLLEDLKKMFMGDSTQNDHENLTNKANGFGGNNLNGLLNVLFKSLTDGKANNKAAGSNNPAGNAANEGNDDDILGNIGSIIYQAFESDNGTKESRKPKNTRTKSEEITGDDINKMLGFVEIHKEKLHQNKVTNKLGDIKKWNNDIVSDKMEQPKTDIQKYLNKMVYFR